MNKHVIIIIAALLAAAAIPVLWGIAGAPQAAAPLPEPAEPAEQTPPPAPPLITLEKYRQIRNGMAYNEVVAILGDQETDSYNEYDEGLKGYTGPTLTSWFVWRNPDGSSAEVAFISNKVANKKQDRLRSGSREIRNESNQP